MIRWSYVLPRLFALAVLLVVLHFGLPLVIRWGLIHGWHAATGTVVDVDRAWASVARGRLRIDGVQFAHSYSSRTNFLQFDRAELSLDLGELAHQRWVIDAAQLRGVQLDTPRHVNGSLLPGHRFAPPDMERLMSGGRTLTRQWIAQLVGHLERRVEDEFTSIQRVRDLSDRWPAEYEQLKQQVLRCRQSAEQLGTLLTSPPALSIDPANLAEWQKRWQEVTQLQDELVRLRQQLERLVRQAHEDRLAVESALATDRERLRARMNVAGLDSQALTDYLMASETYRWWQEIRPYLNVAQSVLGAPEWPPTARRGIDIVYDEQTARPKFLIRSAELDGQLSIAGQKVTFVGRACNLCGEPDVLGQPARLQLLTQGPFRANMYLEFDKPGAVPRQRVVFQCSELPVDSRTWGSHDELAVTLAPGIASIYTNLVRLGDDISGSIVCNQENVQLTLVHATLTSQEQGPADLLRRSFANAARRVDRFDLQVTVTGTLDTPEWKVQSDLGATLEASLHQAAEEVLHAYAEQLIAQAERRITDELARLRDEFAGRQAELQQHLGESEKLLSSLVEPVAGRVKPFERLLRRF